MNEDTPIPGNPDLSRRWAKIQAKLEAAKPRLVTAGGVYERRRPNRTSVWLVRYPTRENGRCRLNAIYLGDELLACKARGLIRTWRAEAVTPEEQRRREAFRLLERSAVAGGYSAWARKRLKAAAERVIDDRMGLLRLAQLMADPNNEIRKGKRPGRPAKARLW